MTLKREKRKVQIDIIIIIALLEHDTSVILGSMRFANNIIHL